MVLLKSQLGGFSGQNLPGLPGHALISGADFQGAVSRTNDLFGQGGIKAIIGAQSFLGQGWDASALNTLVLGTRLKSFVAIKLLTRMARMVIASLAEIKDLSLDLTPTVQHTQGQYVIGINAACKLEDARFHDALQQMLNPVDKPRYVIALKSGLIHSRYQYFALPDRFVANKQLALVFWRNWQGYVGRGQLVYTRTVQGRAVLQSTRLSTQSRTSRNSMCWQ